ncbi:MAG: hypothetical protein ABI823_17030, partial [Bryobacteraceae bacterium]
ILAGTGFSNVRIAGESHAPFGVLPQEDWSLPIAARKGAFVHEPKDVAELVGEYRELLKRIRALDTELAARAKELEEVRAWAAQRESETSAELVDRTNWARDLEKQLEERTAWAQSLERDLNEHVALAKRLQEEGAESSKWAQDLDADLKQVRAELAALRTRLLVRIGRRIGLA